MHFSSRERHASAREFSKSTVELKAMCVAAESLLATIEQHRAALQLAASHERPQYAENVQLSFFLAE